MIALTAAERERNSRDHRAAQALQQRISRAHRAAQAFSKEHLYGETRPTTEQFIGAKGIEFCQKHILFSVQFDAGLLSVFEATLVDNCTEDEGNYTVEDLMWAWKEAERGVDQ